MSGTGQHVDVQLVVVPIRVNEHVVGVYGIARDITDRRAVERMKDEFVSVTSHELRTPLTAIRGALGLLESGLVDPASDRGRETLRMGVANADRLIRIVNDLLDLERMESGQVTLKRAPHDARQLANDAVSAIQPLAAEAGVHIDLEGASPLVLADHDRIVQTLTNLLGNAIKFSSPSGRVTVAVRRERDEAVFEVRDYGRGIPRDRLESIFLRFVQVDASDAREKGGAGLGLPICKTIVRQHGGRIWAESELARGSTFSFTLPLADRNATDELASA